MIGIMNYDDQQEHQIGFGVNNSHSSEGGGGAAVSLYSSSTGFPPAGRRMIIPAPPSAAVVALSSSSAARRQCGNAGDSLDRSKAAGAGLERFWLGIKAGHGEASFRSIPAFSIDLVNRE